MPFLDFVVGVLRRGDNGWGYEGWVRIVWEKCCGGTTEGLCFQVRLGREDW